MKDAHTLLVAADDHLLRGRMAQAVGLRGYDVRTAASAAELLLLIDRLPLPDLLVMDMTSPDGIGLELLPWLRRIPLWSRLPVVLLTADHDDGLARAVAGDGAIALLTKPFRMQDLLAEIELLLYGSRVTATTRFAARCPTLLSSDADPLTGCLTRTAVLRALDAELARSAEERVPLSVIRIDLDHLGCINSTMGREAGDAVLRRVGAWLGHAGRCGDHAGRYDGDEFLVVLPDADEQGAATFANRAHSRLSTLPIEWGRDTLFATFSAGIAAHGVLTGSAHAAEHLVERAGAALREAKRAGRHAICFASTGTAIPA